MFLQDVLSQTVQSADPVNVQRILEAVIPSVVVGLLAYLLARRKNISEAAKNEADAEKSLAEAKKSHVETEKLYIEMVATLNDEIGDWIKQVKTLRDDADGVLDDNGKLKAKIRDFDRVLEDKIISIKNAFIPVKTDLGDHVDKTGKIATDLLNSLISKGISQEDRMKAVLIVEDLHSIKSKIQKCDNFLYPTVYIQ